MNPYIQFEDELRKLFKEEKKLNPLVFGTKFINIIIRIKKWGKKEMKVNNKNGNTKLYNKHSS